MSENPPNLNPITGAQAVWLVVPCYEEEQRLPRSEFIQFAEDYPQIRVLFVNDGSKDGTLAMLRGLAAGRANMAVLDVQPNGGKAEAVRAGFLEVFKAGAELIGYWDADLATPLREVPEFIAQLRSDPETQMVLGARVQLLGRNIHRKLSRHYIGRIFATLASTYLGVRIYDTQCGAKLFRNTPTLREVFAHKWVAKWLFDVELLVRYLKATGRKNAAQGEAFGICEMPLQRWEDVAGSKVKPGDFLKAWLELFKIMRTYGRPLK